MRRILVIAVLMLTACGSPIDKQYQNRQIAYVDVQAGPKASAMQVAMFKSTLQPALIGRLQGRGQPPAVGLTVVVLDIDLPNGQNTANYLLGHSADSASAIGEVQLWDPATRAVLTKFSFGSRITLRNDTMMSDMLGYSQGSQSTSDVYYKLADSVANEINTYMYRKN